MPQIIVEHDIDIDFRTLENLREKLSDLCAKLFKTTGWPLSGSDFRFKFERVLPPSTTTHNVIISMSLHDFPERIHHSEAHAEQIRNAVIKTLNNHEFYLEKQSFPTVGVDLTYAHKAWSAGSLLDARPGFAVLGRDISGGGSTGGGTKD